MPCWCRCVPTSPSPWISLPSALVGGVDVLGMPDLMSSVSPLLLPLLVPMHPTLVQLSSDADAPWHDPCVLSAPARLAIHLPWPLPLAVTYSAPSSMYMRVSDLPTLKFPSPDSQSRQVTPTLCDITLSGTAPPTGGVASLLSPPNSPPALRS